MKAAEQVTQERPEEAKKPEGQTASEGRIGHGGRAHGRHGRRDNLMGTGGASGSDGTGEGRQKSDRRKKGKRRR